MNKISIVWLRRDLRLQDQAALYHALNSGFPVLPLFIFDKNILDDLQDADDLRVNFIYQQIKEIKQELQEEGSDLLIMKGDPLAVWKEIIKSYEVQSVFLNRDYEPYAKERDAVVISWLKAQGVEVYSYKDHLIFESHEVTKENGEPYVVFTPYKKVWLQQLNLLQGGKQKGVPKYEINASLKKKFINTSCGSLPSLKSLGFEKHAFVFPEKKSKKSILIEYDKTRDYPAIEGTSRLGIHLRFGTISIRKVVEAAGALNQVFLSELIWREFYSHILDRFPQVVGHSFKPQYDQIKWLNNESDFRNWCNGTTGYPLVDAGMRELNRTGYMHNRIRMVTASFLTKHLLIDWRWGEAYFARRLLDFDLSSNNGGWQWAAGSGTDAAPYFRIFNPEAQQKKFDPEFKYIRQWVPEFGTESYPDPIVEHKMARERCLQAYKMALGR